MNIDYQIGDASNPGDGILTIIAHVCNNIGVWGGGFTAALSARDRLPDQRYRRHTEWALGAVEIIPFVNEWTCVANMVAQHGVGRAQTPIRYDALEQCLTSVADTAAKQFAVIRMPRIGCGLAGGTWADVEPIVRRCLTDRGIPVTVCDLS